MDCGVARAQKQKSGAGRGAAWLCCGDVLLLADHRPRLRDAALYEFGFDLQFLVGTHGNFGFKGLVAGQSNAYLVLVGRDQQAMAEAGEFVGMADEAVVNEDGGPARFHGDFQFGGLRGHGQAGVLHQPDLHHHDLARLQHRFLGKVLVAGLAHGKLVLAWQEKDLFVAF